MPGFTDDSILNLVCAQKEQTCIIENLLRMSKQVSFKYCAFFMIHYAPYFFCGIQEKSTELGN